MNIVDQLQADARTLHARALASYPWSPAAANEIEGVSSRIDAAAAQLAHADPAYLDMLAIVAADVAEAPLPDGWTARVISANFVGLDHGGWRCVVGRGASLWTNHYGAHAHLADVVAAVTGAER